VRQLHPETEEFLTQIKEMGAPEINSLPVEEARVLLKKRYTVARSSIKVDNIQNLIIPGPGGDISIRIYSPRSKHSSPVLVFFHGGGWVLCDVETHDSACRWLANETPCMVISVEYRLAPEHKFPRALEDCYAVTEWAAKNIHGFRGDPKKIALCGDSSGGNLAAAVSLLARDKACPFPIHQVLIYPILDYAFDTESYLENAEGYLLTRASMKWYWSHYLERDMDGKHPYAAPLQARDLRGLPSATIVTCGFDPLRDEGILYGQRLIEAGVKVDSIHYEDQIHGFLIMVEKPRLSQSTVALNEVSSFLRSAFYSE